MNVLRPAIAKKLCTPDPVVPDGNAHYVSYFHVTTTTSVSTSLNNNKH